MVEEINTLVQQIRDINISLNDMAPSSDVSQQSADLLDRRDSLLDQLALNTHQMFLEIESLIGE